MAEFGLTLVEQGMRVAQQRAAVLAVDAANARTPGFVAGDVKPVLDESSGGMTFAAAVQTAQTAGEGGTIEYAMAATAENSVRFRALADQEHAMLREFRTVADEGRR